MFFVTQRYPYKINYHIGQDALDGSQYRKRKLVFRHAPVWTLGHMAKLIDTFLKDLKLLEDRFNQVLSEEISKSENIILSGFFEDIRMKLVPYARYTRFDVSLDISVEDVAGYIVRILQKMGADILGTAAYNGADGEEAIKKAYQHAYEAGIEIGDAIVTRPVYPDQQVVHEEIMARMRQLGQFRRDDWPATYAYGAEKKWL